MNTWREYPGDDRGALYDALFVALAEARQRKASRPIRLDALEWLLRDDLFEGRYRQMRRKAFWAHLNTISRQADRLYAERLTAANGPWDFESVYVRKEKLQHHVRYLRGCCLLHAVSGALAARLASRSAGHLRALWTEKITPIRAGA